MKGLVLASDIWMSDPFLLPFLPIFRFKLLVEYEDCTCATESYLIKLLLMVKYTIQTLISINVHISIGLNAMNLLL